MFYFPEEEYTFTWPGVHVKGVIIGHLSLEIIGKVVVTCEKSNLCADIEFKKKTFFGKYNEIQGKIKQNGRIVYILSGFWDQEMNITKCRTNETELLFSPEKYCIEPKTVENSEDERSSKKVWADVVRGIVRNNEEEALAAKSALEAKQRQEAQIRHDNNTPWIPRKFVFNKTDQCFEYKEWGKICH